MNAAARYVGRFAPSPTGPLHAGSLVAALASWLDARAASGRWLVRIEDVDLPRCQSDAAERILAQLAACGLLPDEAPLFQSTRNARYQQVLDGLLARQLAYPCACTRRDIEAALIAQGLPHERHVERPYPGTCRLGLHGRAPRAWRFHAVRYQGQLPAPSPSGRWLVWGPATQATAHGTETSAQPPAACFPQGGRSLHEYQPNLPLALDGSAQTASLSIANNGIYWMDRRLGPQFQDVARQVGDFVLRRADGLWAYQLAVVVDDADQGVTHIVRGEDLADNTPRQILLQSALGLPTPRYLHTPLVRAPDGEKLSKQHGAPAINDRLPLQALAAAAQALGLPSMEDGSSIAQALELWIQAWARNYNPPL